MLEEIVHGNDHLLPIRYRSLRGDAGVTREWDSGESLHSNQQTPPERQDYTRQIIFHHLTSVNPESPGRLKSRHPFSCLPALSLYGPRQPESSIGSTYVSRVRQQVLLKGAGLSPQLPLRPDPVGQVPHDDTLRPPSRSCGL